MNLISCDNCGVALDKDKLGFSPEIKKYLDNGTVDLEKFEWDGDDYVAKVDCPVCQSTILKE